MSLDHALAELMDRVRGEAVKEVTRKILVGDTTTIRDAVMAEVRVLLRDDPEVRAALKAAVLNALERKS